MSWLLDIPWLILASSAKLDRNDDDTFLLMSPMSTRNMRALVQSLGELQIPRDGLRIFTIDDDTLCFSQYETMQPTTQFVTYT